MEEMAGEVFGALCSNWDVAKQELLVAKRIEDRRYRRCVWPGVDFNREVDWSFEDRTWISRVEFDRCEVRGSTTLRGLVFDDVSAVGLKGSFRIVVCAFRHFRVAGRVSEFWVSQQTYLDEDPVVEQNDRFHEGVDWTLDVSELDGRTIELRDMEPSKVRLDPTRQMFVSASSVGPGRAMLETIDLPGLTGSVVRWLLEGREGDQFYSVNPKDRTAADERELVQLLHAEGLTIPTYEG